MPHFEYRIHPSVGIARMGNSLHAYFMGREAPTDQFQPALAPIPAGVRSNGNAVPAGEPAKVAGGTSFWDADGKLAKQGARFRIFCFQYDDYYLWRDTYPTKVWEVTTEHYDIEWEVEVANLKSWDGNGTPGPTRALANTPDALKFDTAPGVFQKRRFFEGKPGGRLDLGSAFMEAGGQLVVLGSEGASQKLGPGAVDPTAGDPGLRWKLWEDDAADGYVRATVKPKADRPYHEEEKETKPARQAWVVVNLPNYAADVRPSVTLHDLALNHAITNSSSWWRSAYDPAPVTFHGHVEPLLKSYVQNRSVSNEARKHGRPDFGFLSPPPHHLAGAFFAYLKNRPPWKTTSHESENYWTGSPPSTSPYRETDPGMPKLRFLALPEKTFGWMVDWNEKGAKLPAGRTNYYSGVRATPMKRARLLDVAHMGMMSGGSFFPGIETGREVHNYRRWWADYGASLFHVDIRYGNPDPDADEEEVPTPGEMTQNLSVPWHADFYACGEPWWPASRPTLVNEAGGSTRSWMEVGGVGVSSGNELRSKWAELGFIRYDGAGKWEVEDPPPPSP